MAETTRVRDLLRRARQVYDDACCPLRPAAVSAWRSAFASGGRWMQAALAHLRGAPLPSPVSGLNGLGVVKYGLASAAALLSATAIVLSGLPWPLLALCGLAFYAVEAQLVFLFPLALDGSVHPFREARCWTVRAGGTLSVMAVVLPLAGVMIFGGLVRQGFVRSWCLGCLAVCIWYEDLRRSPCPR